MDMLITPPTTASASTLIPVQNKRVHRARFLAGLAQELPAVFTVVAAGASALQGEHGAAGLALAGAELIAGACVLGAIALETRHLFGRHAAKHEHSASHETTGIDKSDLAAAALGYVEAWHRTHVVGHFKLVSPQMVGATLSLLLAFRGRRALSERRERRRPHVAISANEISYLAGPRRRWRAAWTEVAAVEHDGAELAVRLHDGRRHVLNTNHHLDGERVLSETLAAITAHAPHVLGALSAPTSAAPLHQPDPTP